MSCPSCFKGTKHEGHPTGREGVIHGLNTYVTGPADDVKPKGCIVIVPDAFGWKFNNNRLLADAYAAHGEYLVYLPDFMQDVPAPEWILDPMDKLSDNKSLMDWVWKPWYLVQVVYGIAPFLWYNYPISAWPRIRAFFEALRLEKGQSFPIGAAGFCWGGKAVMSLAQADAVTNSGEPLVNALFTGHPSALTIPADVEKVVRPVSIAIGDRDFVLSTKQVKIIRDLWDSKVKETPTEIVEYPGAGHGFCVRVDPKNKNQYEQSLEAEKQAIAWFKKHF